MILRSSAMVFGLKCEDMQKQKEDRGEMVRCSHFRAQLKAPNSKCIDYLSGCSRRQPKQSVHCNRDLPGKAMNAVSYSVHRDLMSATGRGYRRSYSIAIGRDTRVMRAFDSIMILSACTPPCREGRTKGYQISKRS